MKITIEIIEVDDTKLKPCPFCGGEAEVALFMGNYLVVCKCCPGSIFPCKGMTKEEAVEAWNRREAYKEQAKARDEFMGVVYDELSDDADNNRANRIIDAADVYADSF